MSFDDPALELEAEVRKRKRLVVLVVVALLVLFPTLAYGAFWAWERGFRVGLLGGLVVAMVLLSRISRRALEKRKQRG